MIKMTVHVSHWQNWLRAPIGQLCQQWVPEHPDGDYPRQYKNQADVRWDLVGKAVAQVSNALAEKRFRRSDENSDNIYWSRSHHQNGTVLVDIELEPLNETEIHIVKIWFHGAPWSPSVNFSMKDGVIGDGRHRLWSARDHFHPDALIPIAAEDPRDLSRYELLPEFDWFDTSDPLNLRWFSLVDSSGQSLP